MAAAKAFRKLSSLKSKLCHSDDQFFNFIPYKKKLSVDTLGCLWALETILQGMTQAMLLYNTLLLQ